MLNQALTQSGWEKGIITERNWWSYVQERLNTSDWQRVVDDVQRFLIDQQELAESKRETLDHLLSQSI